MTDYKTGTSPTVPLVEKIVNQELVKIKESIAEKDLVYDSITNPEGSVVGIPGTIYIDNVMGTAWLKTTGENTKQGWSAIKTDANTSTTAAGTIFAYAGTVVPTPFLLCDGASYACADYPELFANIGYTWGGSAANFNVPDLRGVYLRGAGDHGTKKKADGTAYAGGGVGDWTADKIQGHYHAVGTLTTGNQSANHHHTIAHTHTVPSWDGGGTGGARAYRIPGQVSGSILTSGPSGDGNSGNVSANHNHNMSGSAGAASTGAHGAIRSGDETNPGSYAIKYIILYQSTTTTGSYSTGGATATYMVKCRTTDTTPDFLSNKLAATVPIVKTVLNSGGNEQVGFSITAATTSATGSVQLSDSYIGTSQTLATTEKALSDGLATKVTANADIVAGTATKLTYDIKGLITQGENATTADIEDSTDARYITDAQLVVVGNTSGTNTGDVTLANPNHGLGLSSQVLTLGPPSTCTAATANLISTNTHTHEITGFLTSLTGAVLTNQTTPQTIGDTTNRLLKLWATDITCTNSITGNVTGSSGSCTGNSASATKATNMVGGNSTTLLGTMYYQSDVDTTTAITPNITAAFKYLTMKGDGTNGGIPSWGSIPAGGDCVAPATNTDNYVPQWNGADSKTLKDGVAIGIAQNNIIKASASDVATGEYAKFTATGLESKTPAEVLADITMQAIIPAGIVVAYAGASIPTGYLDCDGSAISRTTYAELFTAIAATWGAGDGSTTFNIPDFRSATLRGVGTPTLYTSNTVVALAATIDDTVQGHKHDMGSYAPWFYTMYNGDAAVTTNFKTGTGSGVRAQPATINVFSPITDGVNGTPRTGLETTGKARGVYYIIKY